LLVKPREKLCNSIPLCQPCITLFCATMNFVSQVSTARLLKQRAHLFHFSSYLPRDATLHHLNLCNFCRLSLILSAAGNGTAKPKDLVQRWARLSRGNRVVDRRQNCHHQNHSKTKLLTCPSRALFAAQNTILLRRIQPVVPRYRERTERDY